MNGALVDGVRHAGRTDWTRRTLVLAFVATYALALASLPVDAFVDRDNYLIYVRDAGRILEGRLEAGWLPTLANEPLWLLLNLALGAVLAPEDVVRSLVLLPAAVVAWRVLEASPRDLGWLLLFLLVPQVVKNHVIHLRQGVAIAVFLLAWFRPAGSLRLLLLACAPLIHASFFFVLALMGLIGLARRLRLAADVQLVAVVGVGIALGLALQTLARAVGARQGDEYQFTATEVSGVGFVFWFAVLMLFCLQGRDFLRRHALALGAVAFYLSTYFLVEVTARIFESMVAIVLIAGLTLSGWRRTAFLGGVGALALIDWVLRLQQPWAGFGP